VSRDEEAWIARKIGRMSTGLKMLLILGLGLLPLGVLAVLASIDTARDNRDKGRMEVGAVMALSAQRLTSMMERSGITIRAVSDAITMTSEGRRICLRTLARLARQSPTPGRYALFSATGEPVCATRDYVARPVPPMQGPDLLGLGGSRSRVEISGEGSVLRYYLFRANGRLQGVGEYDRDAIAELLGVSTMPPGFHISLNENGRIMNLTEGGAAPPQSTSGANGFRIRVAAPTTALTYTEILIVLLPILMWLLAALIGWFVVDRLLLRPLARVQRVVSAYRPGDRALDLPTIRSPAKEIAELGLAFDRVTQTVARHEADLEAAVERQTRLVREVHHRVKNNLQVVASLLNLHSRGAADAGVAAAYASIQRRVDALAVVHRNHYAELEENRGVALKPLLSELGANLRANAPAEAAHMQIRLDIAPVHATQDVAVSVAFLVTEIVELGMLCGATEVSLVMEREGPGRARLTLETDSLIGQPRCDETIVARFDRIIIGLARQLRSTLDHDEERGRYSVRLATTERSA
jgi:two-component system, sensor histidine kinase PdtaS